MVSMAPLGRRGPPERSGLRGPPGRSAHRDLLEQRGLTGSMAPLGLRDPLGRKGLLDRSAPRAPLGQPERVQTPRPWR
jgi:hypothetical protein